MTLNVEDGTGLSNADAFVSLAAFQAYCANRGYDLGGASSSDLEAAIRRATTFVDVTWRDRWSGQEVIVTQALSWPRNYAIPSSSRRVFGYLPNNVVPQAVKDATCEAAYRETIDPGGLMPDQNPSEVVTSFSIGPISQSFGSSAGGDTTPQVSIILRLVAPLLRSRGPMVLRA